jgi:hypothetical protein
MVRILPRPHNQSESRFDHRKSRPHRRKLNPSYRKSFSSPEQTPMLTSTVSQKTYRKSSRTASTPCATRARHEKNVSAQCRPNPKTGWTETSVFGASSRRRERGAEGLTDTTPTVGKSRSLQTICASSAEAHACTWFVTIALAPCVSYRCQQDYVLGRGGTSLDIG